MMQQKNGWDKYWRNWDSVEEQSTFYGRWLRRQRFNILKLLLSKFDRSISILEVGCGSGEILILLRSMGFCSSIGIDYSAEAIKTCEKHGFIKNTDVYHTSLNDFCSSGRTFDMIIEEGVWEHYPPHELLMLLLQTAQITRKYILACQPNALTPAGYVISILAPYFSPEMRYLPEQPYPHNAYTEILKNAGFSLIGSYPTLLQEFAWLVYRREKHE